MTTPSIIDISREFFREVALPILERHFPAETAQTAFGVFGYGSEALGLDDDYSRDHHWGLRNDALMPAEIFAQKSREMLAVLAANLPATYQGHSLREGHLSGAGLAPDSLPAFLTRTLGIDHPPESAAEWLAVPEEDIIHVINGEIWHDPRGEFTRVRRILQGYYPEPVRRRRIAHWCRYFSGMGTYALKRAILRRNDFYAHITFTRAMRLGVQIAFLLDRRYYPYDKWTLAYFKRLPRLAEPLLPLLEAMVQPDADWEHRLALLEDFADVLDRAMVEDGLIQPHPPFQKSPTSGYRLLEHAYAEIIQGLPADIQAIVPVWDQIYHESFHARYVADLDLDHWDSLLQLTARDRSRS